MLVSDSVVAIGDGFPTAFDGAIRYLTHVSPAEIEWLHNHGKGFAGVHETGGLSLGYATGQREGAYARDRSLQLAAQVGVRLPPGLIVWLGCFDADSFDVAGAQGYIDGANSELNPAGMRSGPYGSAGLGQHTARWGAWWQCMSSGFWLNRYAWSGATLRQGFFSNSYDSNVVQSALWGNWFGAGVVTPTGPVFHGGGGQEDRSKVAVTTRPGPGPRAIDAAVVGPDGNVWGAWAVDPLHLDSVPWENLGSPYGAASVSLAWTLDGSELVLTCHGPDPVTGWSAGGAMYVKIFDANFGTWLNGGAWTLSNARLAA